MWLASIGSIVVISLVGLLAVAALPLLRGRHRKAALQVMLLVVVVCGAIVKLMMMAMVKLCKKFGTCSNRTVLGGSD